MNSQRGNSAIQEKFRESSAPLFIPFITGGDPTPAATIDIALALQEQGADILELGVPYSDPLADGPTIQKASARALANKVTIHDCIRLVGEMRRKGLHIPVILFTYYNPVMQFGFHRLFEEMKREGLDGLLVPDLPLEETQEIKSITKDYDIPLISLVAPTSKQRVQKIAQQAEGFLYCVSSLGVTGARAQFAEGIEEFLQEVRSHCRVPIAVGFGISTPEQMKALAPHSDGLIVGSALVRVIEEVGSQLMNENTKDNGLQEIKRFVQTLKCGVR
ncbi:MAG TPA: tryptophan synthase subunit alpha [Bacillota bacterium]|nr:tryptophan synthase subunit alpha [Bacillota bacterium]